MTEAGLMTPEWPLGAGSTSVTPATLPSPSAFA